MSEAREEYTLRLRGDRRDVEGGVVGSRAKGWFSPAQTEFDGEFTRVVYRRLTPRRLRAHARQMADAARQANDIRNLFVRKGS